MGTVVLKSEQFNLPEEIAKKLKGKKVEVFETKEGILLKPVENPIKAARGCLKGLGFTSEAYMQQKREEKNLEQ